MAVNVLKFIQVLPSTATNFIILLNKSFLPRSYDPLANKYMILKLKIILNLSHVACIVRFYTIFCSERQNNVSLNTTYHTGITYYKNVFIPF